jgi:hypothetical protein
MYGSDKSELTVPLSPALPILSRLKERVRARGKYFLIESDERRDEFSIPNKTIVKVLVKPLPTTMKRFRM